MSKIEKSVPLRASPSEVYSADKLHLHFTCGFSFRHSLKLPFAPVLLVSKGSNDERLSINQIKKSSCNDNSFS